MEHYYYNPNVHHYTYKHTDLCINCSHHSWTSFEAMAEIYNEVQRVTENSNAINMAEFLAMHPIREGELLYNL